MMTQKRISIVCEREQCEYSGYIEIVEKEPMIISYTLAPSDLSRYKTITGTLHYPSSSVQTPFFWALVELNSMINATVS